MAYLGNYSDVIHEYVNIHGRDIRVAYNEKTGDILVPIDALKEAGFTIYKKSQYSKLLVDDSQFNEEFNLYMLQCAKTYMLQNKIAFKEQEVIESINNCKKLLTQVTTPAITNNYMKQCGKTELLENHRKYNFPIKKSPSPSPKSLSSVDLTSYPENGIENSNGMRMRKPKNNYASKSHYSDDGKENCKKSLRTIELSGEHNVVVSFVENSNSAWVQNAENVDILYNIVEKIPEEVNEQKVVYIRDFKYNHIYLAKHGNSWFRCKITKFKPLTVFFIDYGTKAQIDELREISKEMAAIPCQAVRITYNENYYKPQIEEYLKIRVQKKFECGTYAVEILKKKEVKSPPKTLTKEKPKLQSITTAYFDRPSSLSIIQNEQCVMLIGQENGRLLLRTKECYDKLQDIKRIIASLSGENLECVDVNQLVLCNRDGKYYRAQITKIDGPSIKVDFLDYPKSATVTLNALRNISDILSSQPITYLKSPPIKDNSTLDEADIAMIQELVDAKTTGTVVLQNGECDLQLVDGLLSEKLVYNKQASNKIFMRDLEQFKPQIGVNFYTVYLSEDSHQLILVSVDALNEYLSYIIKTELEDDVPYIPIKGEICFGWYQETWSRCLVKEITELGFEVKFIDFGNSELVNLDQIRKLTDDVKKIPVLGIPCKLTELMNDDKKLKEAIKDGEIHEVNVKKLIGDTYEIEIPSIQKS